MIKVHFRFKTPGLVETIKQNLTILSEQQTKRLADETVIELRNAIKASIQRPGSTGDLENGMFAEPIPDGYGIGNIDYLNEHNPEWYWINFGRAMSGRTVPPITKGHFEPGSPIPRADEFRKGRWVQGDDYYLVPKRPIEAHNYIEKALNAMATKIDTLLKV